MRHGGSGCALVALLALALTPALEAQPFEGRFTFGFEGPDVISGGPGRQAEETFFCTITDVGPEPGAQGWAYGMVTEDGLIADFGIGPEGPNDSSPTTDAALLFANGFKVAEFFCPPNEEPTCEGDCAAVSAIVLSFTPGVTLPALRTSTVAFIRLATDPANDAREIRMRYVDGCRGRGQPVQSIVTIQGQSAFPILGEKVIALGPFDSCVLFEEHVVGFSDRALDSDAPFDGIKGVVDAEIDVCGDDCDVVAPTPEGQPGAASVFANIVSEARHPVQSWTVVLDVRGGATLAGATTRGTVADVEPLGLRSAAAGFEQTEVSATGALSSVVLAFNENRSLPPVGTRSVLRLDLTTPPLAVDETRTASLHFGRGRDGGPASTNLSADGFAIEPCNAAIASVSVRFESTAALAFRRGDANGDTIANVSDAIWTLERFFRAGPDFPCAAAADTNGDGVIRPIEDALWLLNHRLREGPPPPGPYPACDVDARGLPCATRICF